MADEADFLIVEGRKRRVELAVLDDGTIPAAGELRELYNRFENLEPRLKAIFAHVANRGEVGISPLMFKFERGDIWTFKTRQQQIHIRLPCFRLHNRWIITQAFTKISSKARWPQQVFDRAERIMAMVNRRESP